MSETDLNSILDSIFEMTDQWLWSTRFLWYCHIKWTFDQCKKKLQKPMVLRPTEYKSR